MNTSINGLDIKRTYNRKTYRPDTVAIVQARLTSTRFPKKVLHPLAGKPCLQHVVQRLRHSSKIDDVIVAVPRTEENKELVLFCRDVLKCTVFWGDEDDVLGRVHGAASMAGARTIVDVTADCPLVCPITIDKIIGHIRKWKFDYVSNVIHRNWPDGTDVQVYSFEMLDQVNKIVPEAHVHRSHSGWNIINYAQHIESLLGRQIKLDHISPPKKYQHPEWRLTLDTMEDAEVLDRIFKHFAKHKQPVYIMDILEWVEKNQDIFELNKNVKAKIPGEG